MSPMEGVNVNTKTLASPVVSNQGALKAVSPSSPSELR